MKRSTLYKTSLIVIATAGIVACSSPGVLAQSSESNHEEAIRTLSVSGYGEASAAPDMATIRFSVETIGKTASEALASNATRMNGVIDTLKTQGIADKDIQTSGLSLNIEYERDQNGRYQNTKIAGYRVYNTVTVRLRNIDRVGETIDQTITAGANRMDSLSFSFADDKDLKNDARKEAVADAKAKASLYATEAGVSLGHVLSISESGASQPRPYAVQARSFAAEASYDSTPIATGENSISARINIIYEIK